MDRPAKDQILYHRHTGAPGVVAFVVGSAPTDRGWILHVLTGASEATVETLSDCWQEYPKEAA